MGRKPDRQQTTDEVCEQLGITRRTLLHYGRQGCPFTRRGKKNYYDMAEVAAWMRAHNRTGEPGKPKSEKSKQRDEEELRKLSAMADNWEIRNQQLLGQLLPVEEVERERVRFASAVRQALLDLPSALSQRLAHCEAVDVESRLDRAVRDALDRLASDAGGGAAENSDQGA